MTAASPGVSVPPWYGNDTETRDRILSKLRMARRRPASRDHWQFVVKRLRLWLGSADGKQVRPPCMLILDLYPNGALRAHKFPPNAVKDGRLATAWEMLEFLLDEVLTPQRENAASLRPASISFTNRNIARALADPVRFLVCEQVTQDLHALVSRAGSAAAEADCWSPPVLAEADGVREFMQRFAQNLIAKGKGASSTASEAPGLIQGLLAGGERRDGRPDNRYILQALPLSKCELLVGQYYCLAYALFHRKPWDELPESWLFRVESICVEQVMQRPVAERWRRHVRFLAVLGGETPGFVGLPSVRAARKRYAASMRRLKKETEEGSSTVSEAESLDAPLYLPSEAVSSVSADSIPDVVLCAFTGQIISGPNANRCSRCKSAYYIDEEAQRADWSRHATECDAIAQLSASAAAVSLRPGAPECPQISRPFWRYAELVHIYMEESSLTFDDLDAIEEYAWPVARDARNGWPVPFVTVGGHALPRPSVERPNLEELSWMIAVMEWMLEHQGIARLRSGMQMGRWQNDSISSSAAAGQQSAQHVVLLSVEPVEDMKQTAISRYCAEPSASTAAIG
ncbi:hypothetical protein CYME_CMR314C [Cyanidioschyzon merolae strain 10D]|uniref:MYND-type domain-containing protein n=1 Tax=Cyanidioschyzon merolae (strain NIES-3377 / 10D) TaxID=280699 RepID=M1VB91_CYAM1|nr:hypothetical protein CYME_CMR314C [Cyanidioschyzon merolae strain 10D]BAM82524.1 hypothetical protein CYME_CMR314C [Cyanidioschyzon merolae strain 10D]|eukprot:XP_005538560.1 hypothetical protein CYME_CMR314C [Cyanidioschyzon merolae strain 10D]